NIEEENIEENEENAADAMPLSTEAELICGKEEIILHEHDADCLDEDGNLICGKLQILEHVHSEECFYEEEMPLDADVLYCGIELSEEHEHDAFCYGCWKLICPLEEHQHSEECEAPGALSEEEEAEIEALIERIAALPDREDFEARLLAEKEAENWTAYRDYWVETRRQVQEAFAAYDLLDENQKSLVSNIFILEDLEYLLSAEEFPAELPEELQSSTEEAAAGGMLLGSVAPWEISLSIPLQVFCENAKNNTEFNLSLLEVTAYEAGNWSFGETLQSLRCVARSGKPAEEEFRLSYPVGSSGSFYYGLRLEGDEPYVQYDDTYYVLQVLLEQDAESVENRARLAKAWRNGSEELAVPEEEIRFENQKTSSLTVTLSLNGFSGETEPFAFVAELSEASSGLSLGSTAAEVSQSLEGTEITFELRDGESICIENIPAGSDIRVQEILKAGFTAYHKLGEGGRLQAGESVVITDLAEAQNITLYFVNSSGYVLPQTGGHGTMVYRLGGLLAILLSGTILLLFNIARRKEGRDAL
ncbi:MAG: LPXTG cell wall anchor domain-containing protein, partial [Bacillota bacterium]|nr:LPXTG cell wall anchor domain-containing protein [Bacillota bacterium]